MNKVIMGISILILVVFLNAGYKTKVGFESLKNDGLALQQRNIDLQEDIGKKKNLSKSSPLTMATAYAHVLNQIRNLESYSGTSMNVQLEGAVDASDITSHLVATEYQGVKGLKIKIVVDKFSQETDMGAVLDDIHQLEMDTDFVASEIVKDSNNLIVRGEIYGL